MSIKKPLVHVSWLDSCSPVRKWHDASIADVYQAAPCQTVGWVLRDDGKKPGGALVLASSMSDEPGDVTAIPRICVVKIRRLK